MNACMQSIRYSSGLNAVKYEEFIDTVSDPLAYKQYYLSNFGILSKKNDHNYLKKLLKHPLFFQLHIFVRLFFTYFK